MSIEDLKEQHILLPEREWGEHRLKTTAPRLPLLIFFLISVAACVLTFWGGGKFWTWTGITLFFVSFFGIVLLCDRAIIKQRKRMKQEKKELSNMDY